MIDVLLPWWMLEAILRRKMNHFCLVSLSCHCECALLTVKDGFASTSSPPSSPPHLLYNLPQNLLEDFLLK